MRHLRDWREDHQRGLTAGQRWADRIRNGMGSWPFVGVFTLVMMIWAAVNSVFLHDRGFDPYPYILLNLALSTLAGLQGAILLIAAKRQDEISAALARHDYETNVAAKQEIDEMMRHDKAQREEMAALRREVAECLRLLRGGASGPVARRSVAARARRLFARGPK